MTHENPFRAGGAGTRVREIQREMAEKLRPIEDALKTEKDKEKRAELKRQMKEVRKEYAGKEREANYSLFNRH